MPEDTKAYSSGVFDAEDFLAQAQIAGQENLDQYRHVLGSFRTGLLFYYFGNLDLVSHMMWRSMDPDHPAYDATFDAPFADVVPQLYERMDGVVGWTLDHMPPGTLLVIMSDHGFTSWRRSFNLNTWLQRNGYLAQRDSAAASAGDANTALANLDWQRTRAYALGLNGLYLNLQGRERWGIVTAAERDALLDEIAARLAATIDPATGQPAIGRVHRSDRAYADHDQLGVGPDLVIGYAKGTRSSDESALGLIEPEVFADNRGAWSGDHCMDHTAVPGILFTNRALRRPTGRLQDLGISILAEFGLAEFGSDRASDTTSRR
jgi:predicted AlkP superfamily phosphohydrolase/phosphomutase